MQWIVSIPVLISVIFSIAIGLLQSCGVTVHVVDPVVAGTIMSIAGMVGAALPLWVEGDPVTLLRAALAGTVLHLLTCLVLTVPVVALHVVNARGGFLFWIVGGYWISIFSLIWLARRAVTTRALKAQH